MCAIEVSFASHADSGERGFLNEQPTSLRLAPEAVKRLRDAGRSILNASPEFHRLLNDLGGRAGSR
jgi:hypothetical protein